MSIIQSIIASISTASQGGGGGGGGGPTYGSWTIEWWEKKLSPQVVGNARVFSVGVDTSASIGYSNESGGDYVWTGASGSNPAAGPLTVGSIANNWHHFSVNSDGTNLYVYMDGVEKFNGARINNPITDAITPFYLGGDTNSHWKGRICDFHIMKGGVKYTQAGYYPSGRLTADASTVLLLPMMDNTYTTSVGPAVNTLGSVTYSTDDPWNDGGGSVQFSGQTTSYLEWNGSSIFALDV